MLYASIVILSERSESNTSTVILSERSESKDLLLPPRRSLPMGRITRLCENSGSMLRTISLLFLMPLAILSGCGYHQLGSAAHLPASVHTLAVPYFENRTQFYHTEQTLTQAVVRELTIRTRYAVVSGDEETADATLKGVVLTESIVPYTYNSKTGQSSSYMITVVANVTLTDRDGQVLYQHQGYTFHQQYEATADLGSFIQEDSPAMERLGRDFAQSLVSDMLESF